MPQFSLGRFLFMLGASLVAQTEELPVFPETRVRSLGREDSLEEDMAAHSSVLAWRIPWTGGAWRAAVHGVAESDATGQLSAGPRAGSGQGTCGTP